MRNFLNIVCSILLFIFDLVQLLIAPLIFSIVGLINHAPWQYYIIMIGGYFGLVAIAELLLRLVFSTAEKKCSTRFFRKFEEIFFSMPEDAENSDNLPQEDN